MLIAAIINSSLTADVPSSTNSYLTTADKARMKKVLEPGLKSQDLANVHYSVLGYKHMKDSITRTAVSTYIKAIIYTNIYQILYDENMLLLIISDFLISLSEDNK